MLGVVWSGRGFGMILHRDNGQRFMAQAFHALIVEVDVGNFHVTGQSIGPYGKTVIVRSDLDAAANRILDRLIAAAMAKDQFESLTAESASQQLMAETDAKSRCARLGNLTDVRDFFVHRCRIAWTIREIDAV